MGDLIDQHTSNEKYKNQLRQAFASHSAEQLFDLVAFAGTFNVHTGVDGTLLVTERGITVFKPRLIGKPTIDHIPWGDVKKVGLTPDRTEFGIDARTGIWRIDEIERIDRHQDEQKFEDRIKLLLLTMTEAQEQYRAAEEARQVGSVGDMMEDLKRRRGF